MLIYARPYRNSRRVLKKIRKHCPVWHGLQPPSHDIQASFCVYCTVIVQYSRGNTDRDMALTVRSAGVMAGRMRKEPISCILYPARRTDASRFDLGYNSLKI